MKNAMHNHKAQVKRPPQEILREPNMQNKQDTHQEKETNDLQLTKLMPTPSSNSLTPKTGPSTLKERPN
jgi:hypothetical protein